ncbi:hypothetical protein Bca52824_033790 [Brassica carinata]|uniref:Uncharacterized protein n=1 Tax=Brassica carinata TaxID=52824 RepID=A0A8X7SJE0_BRACI|nr:hypothetical protein Bca52824_033790 [Brassica carinata]
MIGGWCRLRVLGLYSLRAPRVLLFVGLCWAFLLSLQLANGPRGPRLKKKGCGRHLQDGCAYIVSLFFSRGCGFPFLVVTSYTANRDVAISQMSPAAIRNMVIAMVLGAEVNVNVDVEFFEMISQLNFITDETFSVSIKARCRLMDGRGPSKADGWKRKYFFMRISPASVVDSSAHWPLPSWASDRLTRILGPGRIAWNDLSDQRVRRSIPRINAAFREVRAETSSVAGSLKRKRERSPGRKMGKTAAVSSSPFIDSVIPTACSSGEPAVDRKRTLVAVSAHVLAASPLAVSSCPDVSVGVDAGIAGAVKLPLSCDSKRNAGIAGAVKLPLSVDSKRRREELVPFQTDPLSLPPADCARLVHGFRLPSSSMSSFEDLAFSREYVEWASFEAQILEENSSKLEGENRDLRAEVDGLKEDATEFDHREKELLSQKTALEADVARLNESCGELVESERRRVESAMLTRFGDFVEKVRKYLVDRDVARPHILVETQLSGVIGCLKLLIGEGIPMPAEKLAENEQALSVQSAIFDQMEVHDLELSDLPSFSIDNDSTID